MKLSCIIMALAICLTGCVSNVVTINVQDAAVLYTPGTDSLYIPYAEEPVDE